MEDANHPISHGQNAIVSDEISDFNNLRDNLADKVKLKNWIAVASSCNLYIFNLNKKSNGNLSIRNTINIEIDLTVKVFDEVDGNIVFNWKLCRWQQLQRLFEQFSSNVKREDDLDIKCVMMEKRANSEAGQTVPYAFGDCCENERKEPFEFFAVNVLADPHDVAQSATDTFDVIDTVDVKVEDEPTNSVLKSSAKSEDVPTSDGEKDHRKHYNTIPQQCPMCQKWFRSSLSRHMNTVHLKIKNYICDICGSAHGQFVALKDHILSTHTEDGRPSERLYCGICKNGQVYRSRSYFKRHLAAHANRRKKLSKPGTVYECVQCNEKFPSRYTLISHTALRHSDTCENATQLKCGVCGKSFLHKSGLAKHEELHSGNVYICDHCGQSFKHPSYLKKHLRRHTGIGKRECTICHKMYASYVNMKVHMKTIHDIIIQPKSAINIAQ